MRCTSRPRPSAPKNRASKKPLTETPVKKPPTGKCGGRVSRMRFSPSTSSLSEGERFFSRSPSSHPRKAELAQAFVQHQCCRIAQVEAATVRQHRHAQAVRRTE